MQFFLPLNRSLIAYYSGLMGAVLTMRLSCLVFHTPVIMSRMFGTCFYPHGCSIIFPHVLILSCSYPDTLSAHRLIRLFAATTPPNIATPSCPTNRKRRQCPTLPVHAVRSQPPEQSHCTDPEQASKRGWRRQACCPWCRSMCTDS